MENYAIEPPDDPAWCWERECPECGAEPCECETEAAPATLAASDYFRRERSAEPIPF